MLKKKSLEKIHSKTDSIIQARRYLHNAKETLAKSAIEYERYTDTKYVKEAAGIAYLAPLMAIDGYLIGKGFDHEKLPHSIEGYFVAIQQHIPLNGKLKAKLSSLYENLHLFAYYRGGVDVGLVKLGLKYAKEIIYMLD